jgi:predicted nuclease of predicted toxin-antitoxin system
MRFLVDRCAGTRLAKWLAAQGHDVLDVRDLGQDPGDLALLQLAAQQQRILVTVDQDFGTLIFVGGQPHAGIVRLPDVPADQRIALFADLLARHSDDLEAASIITVQRDKLRILRPPR